MQLKTMEKFKTCEIQGCKNFADYNMPVKGLFRTRMCICEECLKRLFKGYMATNVPKPIESPFRQNNRIKKSKEMK